MSTAEHCVPVKFEVPSGRYQPIESADFPDWRFQRPYFYKGAWRTRGRNAVTSDTRSITIPDVPEKIRGSVEMARSQARDRAFAEIRDQLAKAAKRSSGRRNTTLGEAVEQYLAARQAEVDLGDLRASSMSDYSFSMNRLRGKLEGLGVKTPRQVEYRHLEDILLKGSVEEKKKTRKRKVTASENGEKKEHKWSPRTRQKILFLLRHFLNWCMKQGFTETNPAMQVESRKWHRAAKKDSERVGIALAEDQARDLLRACREKFTRRVWCEEGIRKGNSWTAVYQPTGVLPLAVMIALRTGLRLGNVTGLRFEHLKNDCAEIDIPGTEMKNHERLRVPVHPELQEALRARLRQLTEQQHRAPTGDQLVVGVVWIKQAFDRAAKRAGLDIVDGKHLRFHDLRHTFASWLAHRVPRVCEQALLGHSISDVTGRYEHTSMTELKAALETLSWLEPKPVEAHDTKPPQTA